jgi:hypothetical protein
MSRRTPETASPSFEIVTVTPEKAEEFLARNTHNRNIKKSNLQKITRALVNGEWQLNGEAVKIAADGTILDGQHRLVAVVQTGVPMKTLLIRGLQNETQETMDTGSPRSAADVLRLRSEENGVILAAIAKKVRLASVYGIRAAVSNSYVVTTAEIVRTVDEHPHLRDVAKQAMKVAAHTGLSGSLAGLLINTFDGIDEADSSFFFERLETGEMLEQGHPIYELRKQLTLVKAIRGQKSQAYVAAIAIKAWNKYRDGETVSLLKFTVGGASPEAFPDPK